MKNRTGWCNSGGGDDGDGFECKHKSQCLENKIVEIKADRAGGKINIGKWQSSKNRTPRIEWHRHTVSVCEMQFGVAFDKGNAVEMEAMAMRLVADYQSNLLTGVGGSGGCGGIGKLSTVAFVIEKSVYESTPTHIHKCASHIGFL